MSRQSALSVVVPTILKIFFKRIGNKKEKAREAGDLDNRCTERTPRKCFRCGSEYDLIEELPKPPKENKKRRNQVCFTEKVNHDLQKECDNIKNNNDQKIYASMVHMYDNNEFPDRDFGDNSKLTNLILDSGATCLMTPQVSDFLPGLLEDTDKDIEVTDGHHAKSKQKGQL